MIPTLIRRIKISQTLYMGVLSIGVGLASAGGIWLFKCLIERVQEFTFGQVSRWFYVLIPIVGGVLVVV